MIQKQFKVDLTIQCHPDRIERLMELFADTAELKSAVLSQYRYYVPNNEQEEYR
jgi:hypothetical protein